jgi:pimeloyl-ACP methyl ester carboxylesterase
MPKPTIVLVHGAFADGSSWNDVISILNRDGYSAIAAPDALRSVTGDAAEVSTLLGSIEGPIVLVGHSYGGTVISAAANGHANVKALVYVSAFAPDAGETSFGLAAHDPGATLGAALAAPVPLADGSHDLYIDRSKFPAQFAADVDPARAALMAATQRPIVDAAGNEPSPTAAWRTIPSYTIYGSADLNIPPRTLAFMAARAHSRHTIVVNGASHVVMVSHPAEVAALIEEAASH